MHQCTAHAGINVYISLVPNGCSLTKNDDNTFYTPEPVSIQLNGVGKKFNREWIFRGMDKLFRPGTVYAITGPNGAGKSTLLSILWGQTPPSTGQITYQGRKKPIAVDDIYRHLVVATPYMDLIEEFTLVEQLQFHFRIKRAREGFSTEAMLDRMYLRHARNKPIANFSSGMKQRVKLALAFFTQADIIFLDEPGTNLDRQAFAWYQEQLKELDSRCLVFIATNQETEYPANAEKIDIMAYK